MKASDGKVVDAKRGVLEGDVVFSDGMDKGVIRVLDTMVAVLGRIYFQCHWKWHQSQKTKMIAWWIVKKLHLVAEIWFQKFLSACQQY